MSEFAGKVVIVTGSSSGIGESTAIEFAKHGAKLTICGRNKDALQKVANEIKQISNQEPLQIVGDIADESIQDKIINDTISKFNRLDVLVNNAGIGSGLDQIDNPQIMQAFDSIYAVNVRAPFRLTHLAVSHLEKTKGNIVNVSSIASTHPIYPTYCSSKSALDMITKVSALQLASKGIRVNSVNPGPVSTKIMRSFGITDPEMCKTLFEEYGQDVPLKFTAVGTDIANMILFLANDQLARNVTGTIMVNDSGVLLDPGCIQRGANELNKELSKH